MQMGKKKQLAAFWHTDPINYPRPRGERVKFNIGCIANKSMRTLKPCHTIGGIWAILGHGYYG